jgi:hypothetical protein
MGIYGRINEDRINHVIAKYEWLECQAERFQEMKHPDPLDKMIETSKRIKKEKNWKKNMEINLTFN